MLTIESVQVQGALELRVEKGAPRATGLLACMDDGSKAPCFFPRFSAVRAQCNYLSVQPY